jgi:hypothetical protein
MKFTRYIFLLLPFLFLNCVKEQEKVAWLKIEKWMLEPNPEAQYSTGELTHNFNQVFLNMNGKILGAFELPAKVPIIAEGVQNFILIPGILNNGINETKKRYPFVENYQVDFELVLEDTVTMQPVTRYFDNVKFLIEDFETPSPDQNKPAQFFENDQIGNAKLYRDSDPGILKWGNFFGRVDLNDEDSMFVAFTTFGESWPKQNKEVYLEMDFMISNSLLTTVLSFGNNNFYEDINVQVMPRGEPEWRKIYIELREIVSFRNNAPLNEQAFIAIIDELGSERFIYLDNIKIVYQ